MSEHRLRIGSNRVFVDLELPHQVRIHDLNCFDRRLRLEFADIGWSKEELTIEIRLLDGVQIRHCQVDSFCCPDTHHCPIFQHLTTDRTSPNKEHLQLGKRLLELLSEYCDLGIVPRTDLKNLEWLWKGNYWFASILVDFSMSRKGFETVKIQPLEGRAEFPAHSFEDFLRTPTTENCNHRTEISSSLESDLLNEFFVEFNIVLGELFRKSDDFGSIPGMLRTW